MKYWFIFVFCSALIGCIDKSDGTKRLFQDDRHKSNTQITKANCSDDTCYTELDENGNERISTRISLDSSQKLIVLKHIRTGVRDYNYSNPDDKIDLDIYVDKSIIAIRRNNKEVIALVSYSCRETPKGHEVVIAKDGGKCYFRMEVNLTKGTYSPIIINTLG